MEIAKKQDRADKQVQDGRRPFLRWIWRLLAGLALLELSWISGAILKSRGSGERNRAQKNVVDAGPADSLIAGQVQPIVQGRFYLSNLGDGRILALSRKCTHLGCSVPWNEERQQFVCPCHGSTFDNKGVVLTPPATRPLDYYKVTIENGRIMVDLTTPLRRNQFAEHQTVHL